MQLLFVTTYRYHGDLDDDDLRELTKKFAEVGNAPGVVAHYSRLDGRGGMVIAHADPSQVEKTFEVTLQYAPWIEFETHPVAPIEETFPVIQRVYG